MICLLLLLLVGFGVAASEETWYLFQAEESAGEELLSRAEPVWASAGIYRTSDVSLLRELERAHVLDCYCVDADVTLFDFGEDVELLRSEEWSRAMLGADYASDSGLSGQGVRIALIDSGLRPDFSELTGAKVTPGINFIAEEGSEARGDTSDSVGHGTFVASIIASDLLGLAPGAELIPLKCFDGQKGSISNIVAAIYAAVDVYGCDVINLSLGTTTDNPLLEAAAAHAFEQGVILVAASGNLTGGKSSTGSDALYYPAAYDSVIGVGAVDAGKNIASFSVQNESVWIAAPGDGVTGLSRTGVSYRTGNGTSYASPFVAAAAALAKEADPALTPGAFMGLLQATAEDIGEAGWDSAYGYGVLNLGLLLAKARGDSDSIILTLCEDTLCLSVYQADPGTDYQLLLAFYDEDGRFAGVTYLMEAGSAGECVMSNYALPGIVGPFSLFTVESGAFVPLAAVKNCR